MSDIQKEKSMPPEQPDSSAGPSAMEVDEQPAGQSTNGVPLIADAPAPANITAESPVTETPTVHAETESEAVTPTSVEAPKDSHLNTGVDSVSSAPGTNTPVDPPMSAEAASDNYHAKEPNTVVLTSTSTPPVPATTGTPSSEGPAPTVPTSDEPGPTPMSGIEEASSQPSPAVNQDAQTSVPQDEAKALPSTEVPTISSQGPESGGANDVMTSIATDPLPLSTPAIASQLSTNPSTPSNEAPAPLQSSSAITSETPATAASTHPSSAAAKAGSQVDVTNQLSSTGDPEKAGTGEQDQNAGTASESVKLDAASTAEKPETPEMTDKKMKEAEETQAAAQARIKERSRRLAQVKAEKEELLRKKDKNVGELLLMLDDYRPLVSLLYWKQCTGACRPAPPRRMRGFPGREGE